MTACVKMSKIADYAKKYIYLWKIQAGRCAITGEPLAQSSKVDMHHIYPDTKTNRKLYPFYLHSIWNLMLVDHEAHIGHVLPKKPPEWRVRIANGLLSGRQDIQYFMTMDEAIVRFL